ncbi:MAG: aspartate aminotransferase family protein, partial [Clostridiaceae bacterium]|nr:aspartate aminotransferase family protein [Clostridiaceae bacterium]
EYGNAYIDFFAGAGALNYGHNNDYIKGRLINYLESDNIIHGLDMYTSAKREFIETFTKRILKPLGFDYKIQFCGPTGTNSVEAALKLARKVKGRTGVFSFMGAFHGMSLGSLSVSSDSRSRAGAGLPLGNVTFMPYPNSTMKSIDTIEYMENVLNDDHSGIEKPAAIILETVQAEGGIYVAPVEWLKKLELLCRKHDILLICDDVQVGCGRTGNFFSFQRAGIRPDMVVLSKSISGYGLPMSILLIKPEYDIWTPGEHNGTFRGNQLAFVAASAALELREDISLDKSVKEKESFIYRFLKEKIASLDNSIEIRGIGMIWGIDLSKLSKKYPENENFIKDIMARCFEKGLIIERAGRNDSVVKILPPLTIENNILEDGLNILKDSIRESLFKAEKNPELAAIV